MKVGGLPGAITPAVDPAAGAPGGRRTARSTAPVPIGLGITAVVVAFVTGAGGASLIHGATPGYAWVAAPGLCGSLFVVARWVIRSGPTPARVVALIALACLTFSYLLVLGGESAPRPTDRSGISHFTFVVLLLAVFVAAAALPAFIVGAALRFGRAHEPHQLHLDVSPQLLSAATGTVMFLLGLLLLATVLWASSPQWRVLAVVSVAVGSPVLLLPFGAYMYERLLSRWRVDLPPRALLEGLEKLQDSTGSEFDEVLCLQASFGSGRVCQVVTRAGHSTLVLSESIADDLSSPQLLAILAHEAAHVRLNHFRRKLAWGVVAGFVCLTSVVVAQMLVGPFVPRALQFAGLVGVLLPVVMLRGLYDTFVIRRHEAEADEFAVDAAGGQALIEALGVLKASGPGEALVHNRWTTHGTWERRARRIQERERSRLSG